MNTTTRNIWIGIAAVIIIVVGAILIFRTNNAAVAPAAVGTAFDNGSTASSSSQIIDTGANTPAPGTTTPPANGFNQKG